MSESELSSQPTTGDSEMHPADPAERRRTIVVMILITVVGALLLAALQNELANIQTRISSGDVELAAGRFVLLAKGCFALLALVGLVTAAVIAQGAFAAIREQRFPHSQARLLFARKIVHGRRAVQLAQLALLGALAFAVVGCTGAVFGWRLLQPFQ
jgi:hypothetical protein